MLGRHLPASCSWSWETRVRTLSQTRAPVPEVADRRMSTSTHASICRYIRTPACKENGPFFSSSTGCRVFKVWHSRKRPAEGITVPGRMELTGISSNYFSRTLKTKQQLCIISRPAGLSPNRPSVSTMSRSLEQRNSGKHSGRSLNSESG